MRNEFYSKVLTPLKGKASNKKPVYGFDVETEHVSDDFKRKSGIVVEAQRQEFTLGSVVGKNSCEVFTDRKKMADYLLRESMRGSYIAATNLEFDFNILFSDRLKDFRYIYRHGLLAAIHSEMDGKKNRLWTLVDTGNYMKASVKTLGKIVGLPKLPHPSTMQLCEDGISMMSRRPKTEKEWKELEEYNVNDSTITYRFMEHFKNFCTAHNMKMRLTIGSTGMDYWRRNFQPYGMFRESDDQLRKHFLGAFRGGITQCFKRGTYDGKIFCFDYKSSYPGVMLKGVDGKGSYPQPSRSKYVEKGTTELIEMYEGICHAKIDAPYNYVPMLGMKAEGRLLFPYGSFDGWFTNYELRKAMDAGYEVTPDEMIYYEDLWKPFKEAVLQLYSLRKKYKKEGHPYEAMVKTLMNSGLFGKWGTNYNEQEEMKPADKLEFDNAGRAFLDGEHITGFTLSNEFLESGLVSMKKQGKPARYSFPILSSYTTMLGRMKLISNISSHKEDLVYADTDSAYMMKNCFETGEELGDFELQHTAESGLFIRSKLYRLMVNGKPICKSKGVGKFMQDDEDFPDRFLNAIATGRIRMERFSKMKESQRIGIKSGTAMKFSKIINLNDEKRDWNRKDFHVDDWQDSEPLKLREGLSVKDQLKALYAHQKVSNDATQAFLRSDLFDSHAVGSDISKEEFLNNEQWFATHE